MNIILTQTTKDLGITAADVEHMLHAVGRAYVPTTYAPTLSEVYDLIKEARKAEASKNRRVEKWEQVFSKLK